MLLGKSAVRKMSFGKYALKKMSFEKDPFGNLHCAKKNAKCRLLSTPGNCQSITEAENNFNLGLVIFFDKDVLLLVEDEGLASADAASATSTGGPDGLRRQG